MAIAGPGPDAGETHDPAPRNLKRMWIWGTVLTFAHGLEVVPGIALAMHVEPGMDAALSGPERVMRAVDGAHMLRCGPREDHMPEASVLWSWSISAARRMAQAIPRRSTSCVRRIQSRTT